MSVSGEGRPESSSAGKPAAAGTWAGLGRRAGPDRLGSGIRKGWNSMSRNLANRELRAMSGAGDSLM